MMTMLAGVDAGIVASLSRCLVSLQWKRKGDMVARADVTVDSWAAAVGKPSGPGVLISYVTACKSAAVGGGRWAVDGGRWVIRGAAECVGVDDDALFELSMIRRRYR